MKRTLSSGKNNSKAKPVNHTPLTDDEEIISQLSNKATPPVKNGTTPPVKNGTTPPLVKNVITLPEKNGAAPLPIKNGTTTKKNNKVDAKDNVDEHFLSDEIVVEGINVTPIETFDHPKIPVAFKHLFKDFTSPTPIQKYTWPVLYQNRDVISIAKTGSGKTLAFGVPCVSGIDPIKGISFPVMLVMAPTRELAVQIFEVLAQLARAKRLKAVVVYGGVSRQAQQSRLLGADIIVATPGRLLDFLHTGDIDLSKIKYLILDEADQMLDMGFEKDMLRIAEFMPSERQTAMFSATWPENVQDLARLYLSDPVMIRVGKLSDVPLANKAITQHIEKHINVTQKFDRLLEILNEFGENDKVLIFCNRRTSTKKLYQYIIRRGLKCACLSSDSTQHLREITLSKFKSGQLKILVATDVASRGLDIPEVEAVINFDFPQTIENYVHRIGRTGRAGRKGIAYTFLDMRDTSKIMKQLVDVLKTAGQEVPEFLHEYRNQPNVFHTRERRTNRVNSYGNNSRPRTGGYQRQNSTGGYQRQNSGGYQRGGSNFNDGNQGGYQRNYNNTRQNNNNNNPAQDIASKLANVDPKKLEAVMNFLTQL